MILDLNCYYTTDRKIVEMLPGRLPKVTFSCDKEDEKCIFQFWAGRIESFYCGLEQCKSDLKVGYDANSTIYQCEKINCSCIPGRFICGEDGSFGMLFYASLRDLQMLNTKRADIGDFLREAIKGPASFSCKTGQGCKFEEPQMNDLIQSIFGDPSIYLNCDSGECLHYSQVPGYVVSRFLIDEPWRDAQPKS
jgi:hypothetical protein